MKKEIYEFKTSLISSGGFRRVSSVQYRSQYCPKCNDRNWHCYIKIDVSNDSPVVYHCFKCNSSGIVNDSFLKELNINIEIPKWKFTKKLNINENITTSIPEINVNENDDITNIQNYINSRIGIIPTLSELQIFHYISNPNIYVNNYLKDGNINVLKNRYWFKMTNGNIIGRYHNNDTELRWLKFKSSNINENTSIGLYKISSPVDLYNTMNVYIAEGIMDIIGLYYHYHETDNNLYLGVLGKDYSKGINYVLNKGLFGNSVNIKIFKDPDVNPNKIWIDNNLKSLFNKVEIYENLSNKDYGVPIDQYDIHKCILNKTKGSSYGR